MNVKSLYRLAAKKLISDFEMSSQLKHQGSTGTYREDAIKKFLLEGRLPDKYGIGSGEIIGPNSDISRQSDLVIYDKLNCPVLLFEESVQVFPSDAVYGIIEVKSRLSKQKLIEALENIAEFKSLVPKEKAVQNNALVHMTYNKPRPFGIIFAYSLGGNSLDSLTENLRDFEESKDPDLWPNMIVVLGEGIIWHNGRSLNTLLHSEDFYSEVYPIPIHFKEDTLFEFYFNLFDILSNIKLGDIDLRKYKELPKKVGNFYVTGHDRFQRIGTNKVYALNERFIKRIYDYCQMAGKKKYKDILLLGLGQIPQGMDEKSLDVYVYYYDPDELPSLQEVSFVKDEYDRVNLSGNAKFPSSSITINGEIYVFPQAYITEEDLTEVPNMKTEDL
ncbi:hypothetical protein FH966_02680 [Lentibacillus cibarius]|uniref:DUF6602 domain-containing protein n=1 Tax=Lentibacillus cibarius TaxID=2583219 RepID=A0A549YFU0_9BACI|nr:DUF6602 domain-containing protein [Lentibacillus cibarius]TRM10707.1 hypothetical protein FH966_02680 [Lentibacillus cibarius]